MSASNLVRMFKGDDLDIDLLVNEPNATNDGVIPFDLRGCTVTMYVKKQYGDSNDTAFITKTGTIIDAIHGQVRFSLVPSDTNIDIIKIDTLYPTVIVVLTPNNKRYTVLQTQSQFR